MLAYSIAVGRSPGAERTFSSLTRRFGLVSLAVPSSSPLPAVATRSRSCRLADSGLVSAAIAGNANVGGTPAAIAIGADGTAWVANPVINAVQRLVRQAGGWTVADTVSVGSGAGANGVVQTGFLKPSNSGTENAPIAFGNRVFVPSTYGSWYPQPSETGTAVPESAPFVGGFQGMTLAADGTRLSTAWGPANTVPSSALPRLSLADNLISTVLASSTTQGSGPSTQTTVSYSFVAIDADTGAIVGTPLPLGANTFSGSSPNYRDTANYTWNTLQMTGVISPSGVFYQGTAGGIVMVRRQPKQ